MVKRRKVLTAIGASVTATTVTAALATATDEDSTTAIAAAGATNERKLPVEATGEMTYRFEPKPDSDDKYLRKQSFRSEDLKERYGDPLFEYEPAIVPESRVPEGEDNEKISKKVVTQTQVIGTVEENMNAENEIWQQRKERPQIQDIPNLDSNVPVYHYQNASDASDMQNRGAPLNVAWETEDSQTIKNDMENGRGGGKWLPSPQTAPFRDPRYVNLPDGGTKSTDKHVMRFIPNLICTTRQYHIRLYDVPFEGVAAIGQAHRDPCDHGLLPGDTDYQIDKAREAVDGFWADGHDEINAETTYVGNTSEEYSSHGGTWAFYDST
ncbi:hypothetical protein C453_00195 [Haloferax elongans ATCC BAA-1513]|uniref:Uncharacterized protein n=1 Tax=Haloferax elongans ATCC BAA-1513 TaxID=1230453 RepID=M0HYC5_HALEO|nr:hypothetical protein [Haloferax elongans]ELZ89590.1 hypothetical protein C453_00195 [Haloferax elongans ATCC BAA-1513]